MIGFEVAKLMRSRRPLLAALALLLFLVLMLVGFYTYAQARSRGDVEFRFTFENTSYFNGLTFTIYAFYYASVLLLPIFAATEGGVQIAGERGARTLHLMLARPVSRGRIFVTKVGVSVFFLSAVVGLFLATTLVLGLVVVGWGELRLYPGVLQLVSSTQAFTQDEALLRFCLAWPAASLSLCAPLAFSLLLSSWSKSAVNTVGTSIAIYLVLYIISQVHFFEDLRPWLFTSHLAYWRGLFREDIDWLGLGRDASKVLAFTLLFLAVAYRSFRLREEG